MSKAIPADPVCSSTNTAYVAVVATSGTNNIPGEPNCRTVASGADQTATPSPSN